MFLKAEPYLELSRASKMKFFAIFAKSFTIDVRLSSKCTSERLTFSR